MLIDINEKTLEAIKKLGEYDEETNEKLMARALEDLKMFLDNYDKY